MQPIQIPIGNLPVHLVCCGEDASVAFVRVANVGVIFESNGDKSSLFTNEAFCINDTEYEYNMRYHYKAIPEMLEWLQDQNLIMPTFTQGE